MTSTTTDFDWGRASSAGSRRSTRAGSTRSVLRLDELDSVCFDLDGVLTDTATRHQAAWTAAFNELFECLAADAGRAARLAPFTSHDYRRLVEGEPRPRGVSHVMTERKMALPEGDPSDQPGSSSAWAAAAHGTITSPPSYKTEVHRFSTSPGAGPRVALRPGGRIRRPLRHRAPSSAVRPISRPTPTT